MQQLSHDMLQHMTYAFIIESDFLKISANWTRKEGTNPELLTKELPLFVLDPMLPLQRLHLNVFEPRSGGVFEKSVRML